MPDLKEILEDAQTIAVVGCSDQPYRTSHKIASFLKEVGFQMIPVNPNVDEVLGEQAYPDLQSVPEDVQIDVVDIFRNPQYTADMVRDAIERREATGENFTVWTQIGVSSPEAEALAEDADVPYVKNRCILVEHGRLIGAPRKEAG